MRLGRVKRVASAVANIEQGEVEPLQHQPPEWKVGIARKAIAMAQHDARAGRVSMAHYAYRRTVVHREVEDRGGFGQDEPGLFLLVFHYVMCRHVTLLRFAHVGPCPHSNRRPERISNENKSQSLALVSSCSGLSCKLRRYGYPRPRYSPASRRGFLKLEVHRGSEFGKISVP